LVLPLDQLASDLVKFQPNFIAGGSVGSSSRPVSEK